MYTDIYNIYFKIGRCSFSIGWFQIISIESITTVTVTNLWDPLISWVRRPDTRRLQIRGRVLLRKWCIWFNSPPRVNKIKSQRLKTRQRGPFGVNPFRYSFMTCMNLACLLRNLCISWPFLQDKFCSGGWRPLGGGRGAPRITCRNAGHSELGSRCRHSSLSELDGMLCCWCFLRDAFITFKACGHVQWICGFGEFKLVTSQDVSRRFKMFQYWSRCQIAWVSEWPLDAIGHYSIWVCQVWLFCYV